MILEDDLLSRKKNLCCSVVEGTSPPSPDSQGMLILCKGDASLEHHGLGLGAESAVGQYLGMVGVNLGKAEALVKREPNSRKKNCNRGFP